jgi:hypothetical protein
MVRHHQWIFSQDNADPTRLNIRFVQLSAARAASIWGYVPASAERIFAASVKGKSSFRPVGIGVGSSQESTEVVAMPVAHDQSIDAARIDFERRVVA